MAGNGESGIGIVVLLVDDSPVQAEARRTILARSGIDVRVASSGSEALTLLEAATFRAALGLLVTDHLMPGMRGPELVSAVRTLLPELPILVLSGLPDAGDQYSECSVYFRVKPCPPSELIGLVRHLLGGQSLLTA